jgi:hypothetical protein
MASGKYEFLFVFDSTTGAPKTGLTLTFSSYKYSDGSNVSPQPSIVEAGGGAYYFEPDFTEEPNLGIFYVVSTGHTPAYLCRYMRPEDWNMDNANMSITGAYSALDARFDTVDSEFSAVSSAISSVSSAVSTVTTNLATVDTVVDSILANLAIVDTVVDTILDHHTADEEYVTTGGDAGRIVRRKGSDHSTVLVKFDMLEEDGVTKSLDGEGVAHRKKV